MNKLASKFVKPEIKHKLKNDNFSVVNFDINLENQKDDKNLIIGNITKPKLCKALGEGDIK